MTKVLTAGFVAATVIVAAAMAAETERSSLFIDSGPAQIPVPLELRR